MKSNIEKLIEKSVASAVSAIEIYNKPNFEYREETFSILIINAWELILKAKKIKDNKGSFRCLYIKEFIRDKSNKKTKKWKYRKNKENNQYNTISLSNILNNLESNNLLDIRCIKNIRLLEEIRNNAIHLLNKDSDLSIIIYELGTATLKNYITFIKKEFNKDLRKYNFYLMPLSFYNDNKIINSVKINVDDYIVNISNRINNFQKLYKNENNDDYNILLLTEVLFCNRNDKFNSVKLVKNGEKSDFNIDLSEDQQEKRYPWSYKDLVKNIEKVYGKINRKDLNRINAEIRKEKIYAYQRFLDNKNKKGNSKWIYSPEILQVFGKYFDK